MSNFNIATGRIKLVKKSIQINSLAKQMTGMNMSGLFIDCQFRL